MSMRLKKLLGFCVLMTGLVIYLFAAAALSELIPDIQLLKVSYFLITGVAWAFPAKFLIQWMNAEDDKNS